jgi:hypothetical protein
VAPFSARAFRVRAVGRAPGGAPVKRKGLEIRYLMHRAGLPTEWRGTIDGRGERIEYTARATGEPARVLAHGAFFGFDFEGHLLSGGRSRPVAGTGYCEFADPGGHLPRLCG